MTGVRDLDALLADAVAAEAARQRVTDRALRQAAAEEATFAGTLVDLAERGEPVLLRTTAGRLHRGVLRSVARDFVVIQDGIGTGSSSGGDADASGGGRPPVFVRTAALASVRPAADARVLGDLTGARQAPVGASFAAVLGGLAPLRPRVQLVVTGEEGPLTGELVSVGQDVLTLGLTAGPAPAAAAAVVPLASVTELTLLDR